MDSSGNFWLSGGENSGGMLNDVWKYSIASGTWTQVTGSTISARAYPLTWTSGSTFWLFGGNSGGSDLTDLWQLN
jgi:hypothetical protein